jgi:hypothetical protein
LHQFVRRNEFLTIVKDILEYLFLTLRKYVHYALDAFQDFLIA